MIKNINSRVTDNEAKLIEYCIDHIKPIYNLFDRCHNEDHYDEVMSAAMIAIEYLPYRVEKYDSDVQLALILAAAYHDIGRIIDEENHHIASTEILSKDRLLANEFFFNNKKVNKGRIMFLAKTMIIHHRRRFFKDPRGLQDISNNLTKELCKILYDCDKINQSNKERVLYRYIAFYLDRIECKKVLYNEKDINTMVENRWDKMGKGTYVGFNPVSDLFKDLKEHKKLHDFGIETGPFEFTKEDILNYYNKHFYIDK